MSISLRIKAAREKIGFSQAQVGALLERSRAFIAAIESGEKVPSTRIVKILAGILCVSPEWIELGNEKMAWIIQEVQGGYQIVCNGEVLLTTKHLWVATECSASHNRKAEKKDDRQNG